MTDEKKITIISLLVKVLGVIMLILLFVYIQFVHQVEVIYETPKEIEKEKVEVEVEIKNPTAKPQYKLLGSFKTTAYCNENYRHICGGNKTKIGTPVTPGYTVAVDPKVIPLGSTIYVEGIGTFKAEDVGGAIKNKRIDIAFGSHQEAMKYGVKEKRVWILQQ